MPINDFNKPVSLNKPAANQTCHSPTLHYFDEKNDPQKAAKMS